MLMIIYLYHKYFCDKQLVALYDYNKQCNFLGDMLLVF